MATTQSNRWFIAIMCTFFQIALGGVYAWSYFQGPIMKYSGWSNVEVAWIFSLAICFLGLSAAWAGLKIDKFGAKKLLIASSLLWGAAWFLGSIALSSKSLILLYLGFGVIGGCGLGTGYVVAVSIAARWFPDKKGLVTGMVLMGFGIGALIMSKVIAPMLFAKFNGDLVQIFSTVAIILFIMAIIPGLMIVTPPSGYVPNGYTPKKYSNNSGTELTVGESLKSSKFIKMWIILFLNISAGMAFLGFQSPLLQDLMKAADPTTDPAALASAGATLIAISSLTNGIGRFFWGGLSDKIGRIQAFRLILATTIIAFISLLYIPNPLIFGIVVCYIMMCYGGGFGVMPSFIYDVFSTKVAPVAYGVILTAWSAGGIVGPQMVAFLKDKFAQDAANYTFIIGAGLLTVGLFVSMITNNQSLAEEKA